MAEHRFLTPAYKLTFSQAAPTAGGALGAVASAAAQVVSGGKVVDTTSEPQASTVVELIVRLDMDTPADSLTLIMGQVGSFRPQRGDQVKVELGYADDESGLVHVMTASLVRAEPGIATRRLSGHSQAHKLLFTTADTDYENKTAGDIVKDLASQAGVDVERAEAGISFPSYVVDGRRSAYQHMCALADLCGFDLYITPEEKLVFEKFVNGRIVHVFEYGKHIVDLDFYQSDPFAARAEAWGESPGGGHPAEAWAWLTKDFSANKGSAGDGDPLLLLEKPALRTAAAARTAAQALSLRLKRQGLRGRLFLTGQPQVLLGDAIRLKSLPDDSLNANYQVRAITHRITKSGGFTTVIEFRSLES